MASACSLAAPSTASVEGGDGREPPPGPSLAFCLGEGEEVARHQLPPHSLRGWQEPPPGVLRGGRRDGNPLPRLCPDCPGPPLPAWRLPAACPSSLCLQDILVTELMKKLDILGDNAVSVCRSPDSCMPPRADRPEAPALRAPGAPVSPTAALPRAACPGRTLLVARAA